MASIVIVDDDAVTRRGPARWSWAILALAVPCSVLGLALRALGGDFRAVHVVDTFTFFMLQAVGALVAARRPDNPIGWILLVFGFLLAVSLASSTYFETAGFSKPMPAGALLLMWLTSKWYAVFFGLISALFYNLPHRQFADTRVAPRGSSVHGRIRALPGLAVRQARPTR